MFRYLLDQITDPKTFADLVARLERSPSGEGHAKLYRQVERLLPECLGDVVEMFMTGAQGRHLLFPMLSGGHRNAHVPHSYYGALLRIAVEAEDTMDRLNAASSLEWKLGLPRGTVHERTQRDRSVTVEMLMLPEKAN